MKKLLKYNLYKAILLLILLILIGTAGFRWIAGYPWLDALYMTVITATTIGFGEVHPLNPEAKFFTITFIFISILVYAYSLTAISEFIIEGHFFKELNRKRMKRKIRELNGHVILVGLGKQGLHTLEQLKKKNHPVVVLEKDPKKIEMHEDQLDFYLEGDATSDDLLKAAGIENARALIATTSNDADNLFITFSARQLNPRLKIISHATDERTEKKLKLAGANEVVMPFRIGGEYMASLITTPELMNFLRMLSVENPGHENLIEKIDVKELPAEFRQKTIADLDLRRKTGVTVIGFRKPDGTYVINPPANTVLEEGTSIIVLGQPDQIQKLNRIFHL